MSALRRSRPSVLVVIASANKRGAEIEGATLAGVLTARGYEASAVALSPSTSSGGLDVMVLGPSALGVRTLSRLRGLGRKVDLVIAYGSSTLPACSLALLGAKTPFVYRSIGDPGHWVRGPLHRNRTRLLFTRARLVVPLWQGAAESLQRLYSVPSQRVRIIPNAREEMFFTPPTAQQRSAARELFGIPSNATVIAIVGALSAEKRPVVAVEAALSLSGVHVLIAGDGPLRASAEQAAAGQERAHFLGVVADVRPVLHAADVLLSTSSTEGMPGSMIEAAMCGLPIVGPDVGAVADIVGERGELIRPDADSTTVADAVGRSLESRGVPGGFASSAFSWNSIASRWESLIDEAVS